ncbi:hypothetical protein ACOTJH_00020 [Achromobacter xylosoxidans]
MPYEQLLGRQQRDALRDAKKALPNELQNILRDQLSACLNLDMPNAKRAEAAFQVARSINTVDARHAGCTIDDSLPWYLLATQLGHMRSGYEHALARIARNGYRVHRRTFTVVPMLAKSGDRTIAPRHQAIDQSVINAWALGLAIIRQARAMLFRTWDAKHFRAAVQLLTDWSLLGTQSYTEADEHISPTAIGDWSALADAWPFLVLGAVQDSADDVAPLVDYAKLRAEIQCALARHAGLL